MVFIPIFQICSTDVDLRPYKCEAFLATDCGCIFHYNCIKKVEPSYQCTKCEKLINLENIEALSYLYLNEGYLSWIGPYSKCREYNCPNEGNPKRFNYCLNHNETLTTNRAVILTFHYFTRFVRDTDQSKKNYIFLKVLEYMYIYHRWEEVESVNFQEIRKRINKDNELHN